MKVAAVIPAYNEELTIGNVVRVIKSSPLVSEVIVVSDGSTDKTAERAREAGADRVYQLPDNRGKGGAVLYGVQHTSAPVLFLADADLLGLTTTHIELLLRRVVEGELAMCVGNRDRGKFWTTLSSHLLLISGERALRREIIESISPKYLQKFMLEPALNYYCRSYNLPYGRIPLWGLNIRRKFNKVGFLRALFQYCKMWHQIFKATVMVRVARWVGKFATEIKHDSPP